VLEMRNMLKFSVITVSLVLSSSAKGDVLFDSGLLSVTDDRFNVPHVDFSDQADLGPASFEGGCGPEAMFMSEVVPLQWAAPRVIEITPIPVNDADLVSISTFSQFVQGFHSASGEMIQTTENFKGIAGVIVPRSSDFPLIGLIAFVCSAISIGMFGRMTRQQRSRFC
jgi:hypothetical protein